MNRWSLGIASLIVGVLAGSYLVGHALQGQDASSTAIPKEMTSYRDVVKKVLPAVVSIESRVKPRAVKATQRNHGGTTPFGNQIPEEFRRFFEEFGGQQSSDFDMR